MTSMLTRAAGIAMAALLWGGGARADQCDNAQSLVDQAIAHYQNVGQARAFADFMNKGNRAWGNGELYIIVGTLDGIFKVHAANPVLIDNPQVPTLRDANGVMIIQEMVRTGRESPQGGWAKYTWTHPETKKLASKQTWVKVHDGHLFMVGCYP